MDGWQEHYRGPGETGPGVWQWLVWKLCCSWLGHRWRKPYGATGTPCSRCGYNSVQLN